MHRHDLDVIAALAAGTLEDEASARALIAACDECRIEYETQQQILAALAETAPATMTEAERAGLHRDLWTALRPQQAPRTSKAWWYRVSYAAASLLVVIGVASVISQTGVQEATETFTALPADEQVDVENEIAAPSAAPAPTSAAAADSPTYAAAAPQDGLDFAAMAESVRSDTDALSDYSSERWMIADSAGTSECVDQAEFEGQRIVAIIENYILAVPAGTELGPDTPITFVDIDTCSVVHVEE